MDKKIVLIGAGSAAFGPPTFVDLNLSKMLAGSTITLVDIDTEKLQMVYEVLSEDNRKIGNKFNIECTPNREKALKGADFLSADVQQMLKNKSCQIKDWFICLDYHFGGFAKVNSGLLDFINNFEKTQGIKLEPIYTGKMLYGIYALIKHGFFKSGQRIIAVHTGGLQGNRGFAALK